MRHRLAVFLMALLAAQLCAASSGVERINRFLDNTTDLEAAFTQTLYDEELNRLEEGAGKLYLQRPGRFRWNYDLPYEQAIVSDGEKLWMYDSELAQVTVRRLDTAIENTPSMLLTSQQPLEEHFDVHEVPSQGDSVWVELRPKSPNATFANIRVRFTGENLDTMELVDNFGQITHLEFSNLKKNQGLAADLFEFTPPEGTDVISDPDQPAAQ